MNDESRQTPPPDSHGLAHELDPSLSHESGPLRIGILGGTFDPIHIGHLILAEEAWFQLRLDRVYLVPAGDPPHKQDQRLIPVEHRIKMA
ncbi:adenylyltransferase/cytidyltransferase family protein, partial [Arthrospira platensis SPKY2]